MPLNKGGSYEELPHVASPSSTLPGDGDYNPAVLNSPKRTTRKKPPKWCCMRGVSSSHSRRSRILQLLFAIFNVGNAALGVGILGLPYAFGLAGWGVGLGITLFSSLYSGYTLTVILRCSRKYDAPDFQSIVANMFGEKAARRLLIAIALFCFFSLAAFMLVMGSMAISFCSEWFANDSILTNVYFLTALAWIAILPLQFIQRIELLGPFAAIGVLAVFFTVGMLIFRSSTSKHLAPNLKVINLKPVAFQAVPMITVGMFCHLTVTPACAGLQEYWPSMNRPNKTRFRTLLILAIGTMAMITVFYIPTGVAGYFLFGGSVLPDVLDNFGKNAGGVFVKSTFDVKFSRMCMFLTTALGYPTLLFVGRLSLFDALRPNGVSYLSRSYVLITLGYSTSALGFALITRYFHLDLDFLLALICSTVGVLIQFIIPGFMLKKVGDKYKGWFLILFGMLIAVIGLFVCFSKAACGSVKSNFCDIMGMGS